MQEWENSLVGQQTMFRCWLRSLEHLEWERGVRCFVAEEEGNPHLVSGNAKIIKNFFSCIPVLE